MFVAVRYIQIPAFSALTGYSDKAVRRKIEEGKWIEGREYVRAPDGHVLIDIEGYHAWAAANQQAASKSGRIPSGSRSSTTESAAARL